MLRIFINIALILILSSGLVFSKPVPNSPPADVTIPADITILKSGHPDFSSGAAELVPFEFNVRNVGKIFITVLIHKGEVYLPFMNMFNSLKIRTEFSLRDFTITGYYLKPETFFNIDLKYRSASMGKKIISFEPDDFVLTETELYLKPELLKEVFYLNFEIDMRKLSISLRERIRFPIVVERERERQRRLFEFTQEAAVEGIRVPTKNILWGGGRIDWQLHSAIRKAVPQHGYSARIGGQLLGGDFTGTIRGTTRDLITTKNLPWNWRYIIQNKWYLSQVNVGDLTVSGIDPVSITGLQLSNAPAGKRRMFSTYEILEEFDPGTSVDLLINGRMTELQRADEAGKLSFNLPIYYGSNLVGLRSYNEWGEEIIDARRILIPQEILPPGKYEYYLTAGERQRSQRDYINYSQSYGLSHHVTLGSRVEYTEQKTGREVYPSIFSVFRLTNFITGQAMYAPGALGRISMNLIMPSQVSLTGSYTRNAETGLYSQFGSIDNKRIRFLLPFNISKTRLRFDANFNELLSKINRLRDANFAVGFHTGPFHIRIGTQQRWINYYTPVPNSNSMNSFITTNARLSPLSFIRGGISYNHKLNRLNDLQASLNIRFLNSATLAIKYDKNFLKGKNQINNLSLNFIYYLPFSRIQSTIRSTDGQWNYSHTINGSIGVENYTNDFYFDDTHGVGRAALMVIPFLDINNNGIQDENEEVVDNLKISTRIGLQTRRMSPNPDGGLGIWNIDPYEDYYFEVDNKGLTNPLWVPTLQNFVKYIGSNRIDVIYLPIIVGGEINGIIEHKKIDGTQGIGGIQIHLETQGVKDKNKEIKFKNNFVSLPDGSFQFVGVPPGKYRAVIDQKQLEQFELVSVPKDYSIQIQVTPEGDVISNINFVLRKMTDVIDEEISDARVLESEITDPLKNIIPVVEQKIPISPAIASIDIVKENYSFKNYQSEKAQYFGPVRLYETIGTNESRPSGLNLSTGETIGIFSARKNKIDLYYTSSGYVVTTGYAGFEMKRRTLIKVGTGQKLDDGISSQIKDNSWSSKISDTITDQIFIYDDDSNYSKLLITGRGGGTPGNPAWIEVCWIYNKVKDDREFKINE